MAINSNAPPPRPGSIPEIIGDPIEHTPSKPIDPPTAAEILTSRGDVGIVCETCPCHYKCVATDAAGPNDWQSWNDGGIIQHNNNCYGFALNQKTNKFPQPGWAKDQEISEPMTCDMIKSYAIMEGAVEVPDFKTPLGPDEGWYVALVVFEEDYHWYRQDSDGCWSHKPGSTRARNVDNSGNKISDPKTANLGDYNFCCYMKVNKNMIISGPLKPDIDRFLQ